MSSWQEYMEEKAKIDGLIDEGFSISSVAEGLDGDVVRFVRGPGAGEVEMEELRLMTADARKYLVSVLIGQFRKTPASETGPVN